MSDEKKKPKKKSKTRVEYDDDYVEREVSKAMKEVEKAMQKVKVAEKESRKAHKEFKMTGDCTEQTSGGMKIYHKSEHFPGTYISIGSAKNVQVGSHNVMNINKKSKGRRSSKRDSSSDSDETAAPVARPPDVPIQDRDPGTLSVAEKRIYDILCSQREITLKHIQVCCENVPNWRRFLRHLGLEDSTIDQLNEDFRAEGVQEMIHQGVKLWAQRQGTGATVGMLALTLQKIDCEDVIGLLET